MGRLSYRPPAVPHDTTRSPDRICPAVCRRRHSRRRSCGVSFAIRLASASSKLPLDTSCRSHTPEWVVYDPHTHDSGAFIGVRNICVRCCSAFWSSRGDNDRRLRQFNNLVVVEASDHGVRLGVLFNVAAPSVAIWIASHVFYLLADIEPLARSSRPILPLLGPLLALAILYFLLNSMLVAWAVAFEKTSLSAHGMATKFSCGCRSTTSVEHL